MSEIVASFVGGFLACVGGIVTVFLVQHFTTAADDRSKKEDMAGFLGRWIGRLKTTKNILPDGKTLESISLEYIEHLWGYYAKCRRLVGNTEGFKRMCLDISEAANEDKIDRDKLMGKIHILVSSLSC